MRKMTKKNKIAAAAASVALVAVGGGAAYAYWSATGTGSGSAATSPGTESVLLGASFGAGIAPGGTRIVTYTASNPNSSSTTVSALGATVTTGVAGCLPAWFTVTAPTGTTGLGANATVTLGEGTLTFKDVNVDQDPCKDATITVNVTSE
ncbi:hypothetical protein AB0N24_07420 [Arthrobacter sp. NPDC093128]|uniref:hypothetical protein n=1 Tax=Arthrobacter sp. NPDC093128 TaxID=3154979 RepID=UPI00343437D0